VPKRALPAPVESTRRALRTALQGVMTFATLLIAVAIPPVGDAINSVLELVGVDYSVTPALIVALGVVGTTLLAVAAKVQNLIEGRDSEGTPAEWAEWVEELADELWELKAAARDVVTNLEAEADAQAADNDFDAFPYVD